MKTGCRRLKRKPVYTESSTPPIYLDNSPLPPTPANIKYAMRVAIEIKDKIRTNQFLYAEYFPHSTRAPKIISDSLGEYIDKWFAQLELKPSTLSEYRRNMNNFWKPMLGHLPLKSVMHSDITGALKLGTWKSNRTRNNVLYMLSSVFNLAVADGKISRNPCSTIESAAWQKKNPDPFNLEQTNRIIASMLKHYHEQISNYYEFMFFSGLRTGEGIGLDWSSIDFENQMVIVKQAFVRGEMVDTKTSSERTVKLTSRAMEALKRQKAWTFLDKSGRVFHNPNTNRPWAKEQNIREIYWSPTLSLLGIRYRRPYCTRATYATIGLMSGARPAYMAAQLGHGLDVFYRDYAKWINDQDDDREMIKIEAQINSTTTKLP
ncbi:MAG: DUF3596 domain-containing protein [Collimonas sp.]|uniref:Arm DNA-binding domain-containing protein n=1 Tax=Collimonas sp. TaxID=1963772 RepID=UPI0032653A6E